MESTLLQTNKSSWDTSRVQVPMFMYTNTNSYSINFGLVDDLKWKKLYRYATNLNGFTSTKISTIEMVFLWDLLSSNWRAANQRTMIRHIISYSATWPGNLVKTEWCIFFFLSNNKIIYTNKSNGYIFFSVIIN